jgi:hypothetical protein
MARDAGNRCRFLQKHNEYAVGDALGSFELETDVRFWVRRLVAWCSSEGGERVRIGARMGVSEG